MRENVIETIKKEKLIAIVRGIAPEKLVAIKAFSSPIAVPCSFNAATSDGGFVLAGLGPVVTVRRLDADLQVLWNHTDEGFFGSWVNDIAVGPGDVVAMAGHGKLEHQGGFVRRFSAPGEPAWTSAFESQQQDGFAQAHALAFGPDFLVGLGTTDESGWIRRFALE